MEINNDIIGTQFTNFYLGFMLKIIHQNKLYFESNEVQVNQIYRYIYPTLYFTYF